MIRALGYLALFFAVLGCSQQALLEKFSSPEDQAVARHYIDLLRTQSFTDIEQAADSSIRGPSMSGTLRKMSALIPPGEPVSVKLVGTQTWHAADTATINTTFEYEYPDRWLLINVAVKKQGPSSTIVGFNVVPQSASLEEQNRFRLKDKSLGQYLILFAAVLTPLVTLSALVICVQTKMKGRKWPWILFILLGIGKVALNWTTGAVTFTPIAVQLFSASAFAPLYGPWTLAVSLPLGAIIFLLLRRNLKEQPVGG